MSVFLVRPRVADLHFQLYGRSLHPELFDILAVRRIERDRFQLAIHITRTGHFISWRHGDQCLTEAADAVADLAQSRRLLSYRLRGEHAATIRLAQNLTYQASFQSETLAPEIFQHVHEEILNDGSKRGLLHNFQTSHRLGLSPLGFVCAEMRPGCLFWSAFHTFPEENTVIKSQTLLEMK
jgi:hypothetical protein